MKPQVKVPIKHIMRNVTVEVKITGLTKWHSQVWIAEKFFRLGAAILNIDLDFKRI